MAIAAESPPPRTVFASGANREERGVVKGCRSPGRRRVARRTRHRIFRRRMVGIRRRAVILLMTGIAVGWSSRKAIAYMTADALGLTMGSRQFEIRFIVIECCRCPGAR